MMYQIPVDIINLMKYDTIKKYVFCVGISMKVIFSYFQSYQKVIQIWKIEN